MSSILSSLVLSLLSLAWFWFSGKKKVISKQKKIDRSIDDEAIMMNEKCMDWIELIQQIKWVPLKMKDER